MYQIYDDWNCPELERLKQLIYEEGFAYEVGGTVDDAPENQIALYHIIQERIELSGGIPLPKSHLYHMVLKIVFKFCMDNDIDFDILSRACINLSYPKVGSSYPEHVDHEYPHKSLLFYLNDSDGETVLHHDEVRISPKNGRVLFFDGQPHSMTAPQNGERIVLVATIA